MRIVPLRRTAGEVGGEGANADPRLALMSCCGASLTRPASAASPHAGPETVKLEGGSEIHIRPGRDFLVIATGSTVAAPAQFDGLTREAVAAQHADIKAKIDSARHVLIVGGGPVGVELAGEIRDAHPDKRVTIVHRGRHLCSSKDGGNGDVRLPDSFGASLKDLCEERSIEVRLGVSVPASTSTHEAGADLALSDGTSVAGVDLILWASGAKPNNATFRTTMAASLDEAGRLVTEPSLLVRGSEHVFALGDCAETGASKTAYMVGAQAPVVAGNVKALADGKPATGLKAFTCGTPAMVVPVGAAYGRGVLPFCGGIQIGNSMVSSAKGKTLFLDKTRADLGY